MKREELKILDLLCDMGIDVNGNSNLQPWKAYDIDEVNLVINELEKKIPQWIWLKDRLPNEKEQNELLWIGWVRMDNTIKYMSEASFDGETKQFYTENDWGDKEYFVAPSVWMVVPQPTPRIEDSSATETEKREVEQ